MLDAVRLDTVRGVYIAQYSGRVDLADIRNGYSQMAKHPEFRSGLCAICDLRSAELDLSAEDIRTLAAMVRTVAPQWGRTKWLAVADSDVAFGLLRMFIALTDNCSISTMVVRHAEEAGDWLELGVAAVDVLVAVDAGERNSSPEAIK